MNKLTLLTTSTISLLSPNSFFLSLRPCKLTFLVDNTKSWEPRSSFTDNDGTMTLIFQQFCQHNPTPKQPPKKRANRKTSATPTLPVQKKGAVTNTKKVQNAPIPPKKRGRPPKTVANTQKEQEKSRKKPRASK
jgi:hypothetical protein